MTFALFLKNWDKILSFQQVKSNNDWLQNIDFIDFKTVTLEFHFIGNKVFECYKVKHIRWLANLWFFKMKIFVE